jgi:hypothetical protein
MIKSFAITFCFVCIPVYAHLVPFAGVNAISNGGSTVIHDKFIGFNTFVLKKRQLIEANILYTTSELNRTKVKKFRYNVAGSYSKYNRSSAWFFGAHYVFANDTGFDKAFALFIGLKKFKLRDKEFGVNIYRTMYENYKPKNMSALQLTPFVKLYSSKHGKRNSKSIEFQLPFVRISKWLEDSGVTRSRDYVSLQAKGCLHFKRWNFALTGWFGKRSFYLELDGMKFSYFNFTETGGVGLDIRYQMRKKVWAKIGGSYTKLTNLSGYSEYNNKAIYLALLFN